MTSRKDLDKFSSSVSSSEVLGIESDSETWGFSTKTQGPQGKLPYTSDFLINDPSGYHFGMSQNAGMGWNPSELLRKQFAILSTLGGMRNPDGSPIALGLHIGHFVLTELIEAASVELKNLNIQLGADFGEILALHPTPAIVAIDIPIGLLDKSQAGGRACDR